MKKGFTSINGKLMVEGTYFNWEVERTYHNTGPIFFSICGDNFQKMFVCNWKPKEKILSIGNLAYSAGPGLKFFCEKQKHAELIVLSFFKANDIDIMPLYAK